MNKNTRVNGLRVSGVIFLLIGLACLYIMFDAALTSVGFAVFAVVLTFLGAVWTFGADWIVSSMIKNEEEKKKISEKPSETDGLAKELQNLKEMKDKGIIDEAEYKKLREKLISK